jgi:hypothetical protein
MAFIYSIFKLRTSVYVTSIRADLSNRYTLNSRLIYIAMGSV